MKTSLTFVCAVLIAGIFATGALAQDATFNNPRIRGLAVDHCLTWATQCDWPAAHAFCREMGYAQASAWTWDYMSPTLVLGSGQVCEGRCGGFTSVTCTRGGSNTGGIRQGQGRPCNSNNDCPNSICLLGVCAQ
ncbi:MAG: hypothetical protein V3573_08720 [Desulfovibrionaceae bacterium]